MSGNKANLPDLGADFASIEAAVMETERGRAFLQEYARRNRHADTQVLLTALSRIEKSIEIRQEPSGVDQFRGDLLEMANAIAKTRKEIAAIHSDEATPGPLLEASGELDSIVSETEHATSEILASAEKIQETAFTMREGGANAAHCDLVDELATSIYTACSFQDLTAQRTRKVIDALGFLENRINSMVDIWAFAPKLDPHDRSLMYPSGSSSTPKVMSQADVDFVLVDDQKALAASPHAVTPPKNSREPAFAMQALAVPAAATVATSAPAVEEAVVKAGEDIFDLDVTDLLPVPQDTPGIAPLEAVKSAPPPANPAYNAPETAACATDIDAFEQDSLESFEDENDELLFSREAALAAMQVPASVAASPETPIAPREALRVITGSQVVDETLQRVRSGMALSAEEAEKALDALKSMSVEERTLLFS